jgi:uncharacterized protein YodC (DUF2158 family)
MKPGDVVQLKSGGPAMTVVSIHTPKDSLISNVYVIWINKKGNPKTLSTKQTTLVYWNTPEPIANPLDKYFGGRET